LVEPSKVSGSTVATWTWTHCWVGWFPWPRQFRIRTIRASFRATTRAVGRRGESLVVPIPKTPSKQCPIVSLGNRCVSPWLHPQFKRTRQSARSAWPTALPSSVA
jgi:hypothetical protein